MKDSYGLYLFFFFEKTIGLWRKRTLELWQTHLSSITEALGGRMLAVTRRPISLARLGCRSTSPTSSSSSSSLPSNATVKELRGCMAAVLCDHVDVPALGVRTAAARRRPRLVASGVYLSCVMEPSGARAVYSVLTSLCDTFDDTPPELVWQQPGEKRDVMERGFH